MKKRWKDGYYALRSPLKELGDVVGVDLYLRPLPEEELEQLNQLSYLKEKLAELTDHALLAHNRNLAVRNEFGRLRSKIQKLTKRYFYDF